jgi:hypothetical protein
MEVEMSQASAGRRFRLGVGRSPLVAVALATLLVVPSPALAHNESVHQRMTDYAYHVMLAAKAQAEGGAMSERLRVLLQRLATDNPGMAAFYADAGKAADRLRALKSGLRDETTACVTPGLIGLVGSGAPDWQLPPGTALGDARMDQVRLPVTVLYGHGSPVCSLDEFWAPSGALASVNPGTWITRDHTGVTLGYWAAAPDKEIEDWVLRSTTLEVLQNPVVVAGIGAGTTVAISVVCALACGLFPIACLACPAVAVGGGFIVIDEITSLDADSLESEDFLGFGHFIDMKPTPANQFFFDQMPAKLMERAGPTGVPDTTESLVTVLFDLGGIHVNHNKSQAPKDYEIVLGASGAMGSDLHRNTTDRNATAWETPTVPHLQLTAVDNLGMFGYLESKAGRGTRSEASRLGWPLHAIGDASVPMHAVGASGFGHRPYEDCADMVYDELVGSASPGASLATVGQVLQRALTWRSVIQTWRSANGTTEVPVRDLVTAVAAAARQKASAQPVVFQADRSLQYIVDQDGATAAYDNPAMAAIQRDLLIEGIAAELAFLVSVTEVSP